MIAAAWFAAGLVLGGLFVGFVTISKNGINTLVQNGVERGIQIGRVEGRAEGYARAKTKFGPQPIKKETMS